MEPVCLPSFMSIGTTVIELREFNNKKKNMDKVEKNNSFICNLDIKWLFHEIFGTRSISSR